MEKDNAVNFLEAVTVCIGYADYFSCCIEQNKKHIDRWIVVTEDTDRATISLCEEYGVQFVLSDKKGDHFNRGALINKGLSELEKRDWVLILDADIVLPSRFRQSLGTLNRTVLYGVPREIYPDTESWEKGLCQKTEYGLEACGYFQMYHGATYPQQRYVEDFPTANGSDEEFKKMWTQCGKLGIVVAHLGCPFKDWSGRTSGQWMASKKEWLDTIGNDTLPCSNSFCATDRNRMLNEIGLENKRCVEVGIQEGNFSEEILKRKPSKLALIDPWIHQNETVYPDVSNASNEDFEKMFVRVCNKFAGKDKVEIIRGFSIDQAANTENNTIDFVYIDAIHTRKACLEDILAWWPKVKAGGWLCGHDISGIFGSDVRAAVEQAFGPIFDFPLLDDGKVHSWAIQKPQAPQKTRFNYSKFAGEYVGRHRDWNHRFVLKDDGTFFIENDYAGKWVGKGGKISIIWRDWSPEQLTIIDENEMSGDFHLIRSSLPAKGFRIFCIYASNIPRDVINLQRKVFEFFGYKIVQYPYSDHAAGIDQYMQLHKGMDFLIFDVDSIPVSDKTIPTMLDMIRQNVLYGGTQYASQFSELNHIFVPPSFMAISHEILDKLKFPSFATTSRSNVGEEITYLAEQQTVPIVFVWPSHCEKPEWPLGRTGKVFGPGTTWGEAVYHAFFARHNTDRFRQKCLALLT